MKKVEEDCLEKVIFDWRLGDVQESSGQRKQLGQKPRGVLASE